MSEVVGQIIMFGILSLVLVMSFITFTAAKDVAEDRVVETYADSLAQRIASTVVAAAVFGEDQAGREVAFQMRLDLPQRVEGNTYRIDLEADEVIVTIPSRGVTGTSPLFQASAPSVVHVCDQAQFIGDAVAIRVTDQSHPDFPTTDCPGIGPGELAVFMETIA